MGIFLGQLPPAEIARLKAELAETLIAHFCYPRFFDVRTQSLRMRPVDRAKRQEVWLFLSSVDFTQWSRIDLMSPEFQYQIERLFIQFVQRNRSFFGEQGRKRMSDVRGLLNSSALGVAQGLRNYITGQRQNHPPFGSPRPVASWSTTAMNGRVEPNWDQVAAATMLLQQQFQEIRGEIRSEKPISEARPAVEGAGNIGSGGSMGREKAAMSGDGRLMVTPHRPSRPLVSNGAVEKAAPPAAASPSIHIPQVPPTPEVQQVIRANVSLGEPKQASGPIPARHPSGPGSQGTGGASAPLIRPAGSGMAPVMKATIVSGGVGSPTPSMFQAPPATPTMPGVDMRTMVPPTPIIPPTPPRSVPPPSPAAQPARIITPGGENGQHERTPSQPLSSSPASAPARSLRPTAPSLPAASVSATHASEVSGQRSTAMMQVGDDDLAIFEQMRHQLVLWLRVEAITAGIELNGQAPSQLLELLHQQGRLDETRLQVVSTLLNLSNQVVKTGLVSILDYKQALMFHLMHTRR